MAESETMQDLGRQVLTLSRNTLMVNLRFMENALFRFDLLPDEKETDTYRVDGKSIRYNSRHVLKQFQENRNLVTRSYLHMVLHCVFRHEFVSPKVDHRCWSIAADISVENIIRSLELKSTSCPELEQKEGEVLDQIGEQVRYLTAECIYDYLLDRSEDIEYLEELSELFSVDGPEEWFPKLADQNGERSSDRKSKSGNSGANPEKGETEKNRNPEDGIYGGSEETAEDMPHFDGTEFEDDNLEDDEELFSLRANQKLEKEWEKIARDMQTDLETFGAQKGISAGDMVYNLEEVNRERYDYGNFLKKFSGYGEEITTNDEEFDNIFYTYGLRLYENMPLIEPLEYKEMKKIRDFVIAVDTSGSVMGDIVQKFIRHTVTVLRSQENFFHKINVHIIQCDADIQEDHKITSEEELDSYLDQMQLHGFGGTDFRPVFQYVDDLIATHEFNNLKGLIYFTDGYGTFPEKPPAYRTAFVYLDDYSTNPDVPPWAIRLVLRNRDINELT